ncbi:solute carrier organic anion transporter family member 74D isoform X2 [Culicoides brevitarsis]|uniref:solute carrier organic anion transporter family member 74D isoform X2 n=1 Tax=Culicoides brevitarsis TaxID=469753 RepID=UPI00307C2147
MIIQLKEVLTGMNPDNACGLSIWHPGFLQRFATKKTFIIIYGLLGCVQAMSFVYFVVSLTTLEKRFQIPSSTTGIVLCGNEISQILLSLILSYFGGQRNRPRWISWGVMFCALSCFILASPHFFYGAGEDALKLTKEYMESTDHLQSVLNVSADALYKSQNRLCMTDPLEKECTEVWSILPLVLIFLSQFVLGIGNTLYYSLGASYLDDNIENKTSTPIMLALAFSLRMFGPAVGFFVAAGALKIYIDPTKTPIISNKDPRWLGAWWLGWVVLGITMAIFAFLIGLFPKELPKKQKSEPEKKPVPLFSEEEVLNGQRIPDPFLNDHNVGSMSTLPIKRQNNAGFSEAVYRLIKNKVLMFNIFSGVFYILGSSGYITFIAKYMEVQFHKTAADATIVTGPATLFGMIIGMLLSGWFISKKKPHAKYLLFWNVVVGLVYMAGQFTNLFLTCPDGKMPLVAGKLINLTMECNSNCICDHVPYSPVCHEESGVTFFSPCHAGCNKWHEKDRVFSDCSCAPESEPLMLAREASTVPSFLKNTEFSTSKPANMKKDSLMSSILPSIVLSTTMETPTSFSLPKSTTTKTTDGFDYEDDDYSDEYFEPGTSREKREAPKLDESLGVMLSGACLKGCATGFYIFTTVSALINIFGASGRIGNLLVNYRCVTKEDKSITQGMILMMISLFALIPGPIIYSRVIDSTCLVFTEECGKKGTCQIYDQKTFRYYVNIMAMFFTFIGVIFDGLVWWYGRNIELYEENEGQTEAEKPRKPTTVLR